jgi:hypothetical protein
MCQSLDLLITNGRLGKDQGVGALTCKNTTVVDYCILSPELFAYVSEFEVLPFDPMISDVHNALHVEVLPFVPMISDVHNALHVDILCKSTCIFQNDGIDLDEPSIHVKVVWDNNKCQSFNDFLNIENIARLNDKLDNIDTVNVNKDSINSLIDDCNDIIIEAAFASGMLKEQRVKKNNCTRNIKNCKVTKPWFNQECYKKRKEYHKDKSYNWRVKSVESKNNLIRCSKEYKKVCNTQYNEYRKNFVIMTQNLTGR